MVNKRGKMGKIRKNQSLKFQHLSELTDNTIILRGTVIGFGDAVRKLWPEEMAEAPDDMLLIWRKDVFGNEFYHAVSADEIMEEET